MQVERICFEKLQMSQSPDSSTNLRNQKWIQLWVLSFRPLRAEKFSLMGSLIGSHNPGCISIFILHLGIPRATIIFSINDNRIEIEFHSKHCRPWLIPIRSPSLLIHSQLHHGFMNNLLLCPTDQVSAPVKCNWVSAACRNIKMLTFLNIAQQLGRLIRFGLTYRTDIELDT